MLPDDVYRAQLQATITALRYWAPSIADAARVDEAESTDFWRFTVAPLLANACPFELILRGDQHYDISIAAESYENRPIASFDIFLPFAAAIAEGRVVQRRWISRLTGIERSVETLITFGDGRIWREGQGQVSDLPPLEDDGTELREHQFLPYRR